ncbi:MAG TPA: hypothetical protein VEA60_13935 [Allosphingosinicella sp.]|nr:hypothetical protein [Allosphingosinicella sp.]
MTKKLLAALALALVPLGAAEAMDVATFLARADAVRKKGMLAMMSSDYKALRQEILTHSRTLRAERLAAGRAGRRPAYCPPPRTGLGTDEILAAFRSIPAAQRPRTDVKDALRALLARKYPCRG